MVEGEPDETKAKGWESDYTINADELAAYQEAATKYNFSIEVVGQAGETYTTLRDTKSFVPQGKVTVRFHIPSMHQNLDGFWQEVAPGLVESLDAAKKTADIHKIDPSGE